jgi:type VI secretion system secreted protein Hcp
MAKADMFLRLEGKIHRDQGRVGRSRALEEIEIRQWGWGMIGSSGPGRARLPRRTAFSEISLHQGHRPATTQLMSVHAQQRDVKKAVLTVRKAGSRTSGRRT